jgi:hypothetical protein
MTALAADRRVEVVAAVQARYRVAKVAAGVRIFKGAIIARDRVGFVRPAAEVIGWKVLGIAHGQVDNSAGASGAAEVRYLTAVTTRPHFNLEIRSADRQIVAEPSPGNRLNSSNAPQERS